MIKMNLLTFNLKAPKNRTKKPTSWGVKCRHLLNNEQILSVCVLVINTSKSFFYFKLNCLILISVSLFIIWLLLREGFHFHIQNVY